MESANRKAILAIAVIVIAGVSIWWSLRPPAATNTSPLFLGVGEILAEEAAKAIGDHGRVVPVAPYDYNAKDSPYDLRWDGFCKELQKHSGITLAPCEIVSLDLNGGVPGCAVPAFQSLLERHAPGEVLVFFVQVPLWDNARSVIPEKRPAIVALDSNGMPIIGRYKNYLARGIITAFIIPYMTPTPKPPANSREWFDKYFRVFTPENFSVLPD